MVRRFIEQIAPSEAELAVAEAQSLLATRHWEEAEAEFEAVYQEDETNAPAALGLVKSLLMQGKGQHAIGIIQGFPAGTEWAEVEQLEPLAELVASVEDNGPRPEDDPLAAELSQSGRLFAMGNIPAAMDGLLDILREDKNYREGLPRKILLAIFVLLGDGDPLTREYRDELASILF
jgi:putative thioredoxin